MNPTKDSAARKEKVPGIVEVDGVQVFSARWVMEQMKAQSCRIDRSNTIAWIALGLALVADVLVLLAVILP